MAFAYWMILVAAVLPYLTIGAAKARSGDYDNRQPRAWASALQGWRLRAAHAERNHYEAFPAFAAAVLVARVAHGPPLTIDLLAGAFIAFRLAYTVAYLADQATVRSMLWTGGLVCVLALFVLGALAA
jgi:uncharacterized MAPEG superfamily protein